MLIGHVLSSWEPAYYSKLFEIDIDRYKYIPWSYISKKDQLSNYPGRDKRTILSSGRVSCDWSTLCLASKNQNWDLYIVCRKRDQFKVKSLFRNQKVHIFSEIDNATYQDYLNQSTVYVASLFEVYGSTGQVRLGNSILAGIPVVASNIKGILDYVTNEQTALLYTPGDWKGLRDSVNRLLNDSELCNNLRKHAFENGKLWGLEQYNECLNNFILENTRKFNASLK
jgi:glycosyltransferase involved in cell wall biosynthesis